MDKMNLYKCAQALSVKWKSFFGLGTEYVGYFKWEMAWALMGYYRYALPGEWADNASPTVILKSICDSIESINTDLDCAHELPEFWLNRDQLPVLPALMSVLNSVYTRLGQNSTPNSNATNLHSSQKRCCSFCISSSNASPTFQVQKSIFHQMTKPIQVTVILPLLLAISFSRNDDIHSSISGISNDLIGVIPTIGQ